MPHENVACSNNMATLRTLKGDVSINLMCLCATSPCVASVGQWLNHSMLSLLQPADTLLYQCGPAHWHGTVSKTTA
jgi:hypothetical protein